MNVELLEKIAQVIQQKPELYDQDTSMSYRDCGTVCCIAGWATVLSVPVAELPRYYRFEVGYNPIDKARELLGLDDWQAGRLFAEPGGSSFDQEWPDDFVEAYLNAETDADRARVGAARIRHFIATDGAE